MLIQKALTSSKPTHFCLAGESKFASYNCSNSRGRAERLIRVGPVVTVS